MGFPEKRKRDPIGSRFPKAQVESCFDQEKNFET